MITLWALLLKWVLTVNKVLIQNFENIQVAMKIDAESLNIPDLQRFLQMIWKVNYSLEKMTAFLMPYMSSREGVGYLL